MASSAALPSPPLSGEFQFAPLRQLLDSRAKRRLRRNHLSEEINEIEAEKRGKGRMEEEIRKLKRELAVVCQEEAMGNQMRIEELEAELSKVKQESMERSVLAEPKSLTGIPDEATVETTSMVIYEDAGNEDELQMIDYPDHSPHEKRNPYAEATTQADLTTSKMTLLQEHIHVQTEHLIQARLELEYICPGETTLGLSMEQGNIKPILDALIDRLRALKGKQHVSMKALHTLKAQESNLRSQFNISLQQLESARKCSKDLEVQMQASFIRAENEKQELEVEVDEKQRSIDKLTHALEGYRKEVKDLESLVTRLEVEHQAAVMRLEEDHKTALADLKNEMDEAVADLECHVVAETMGRREAEEESERQTLRIRELQARERELQDARNEKQAIIRKLEEELESERRDREVEVGGLNVRIGQLSSSLSEARAEVVKLETERIGLVRRVQEEQAFTASLLEQVNQTWETHQKGTGQVAAEHTGLQTPVSTTKFKDACMESLEGRVEMGRGKKTRSKRGVDSGIGILEEDEGEEMTM